MSLNLFTSNSRQEVLDTIQCTPNITAGEIAKEVGLSSGRVLSILSDLKEQGRIDWKMLPPEQGIRNNPRRGYFVGEYQGSAIPKAWDVLAHFFGRIAAEPAVA
jgi:predicted ArsR family transcriptional regulator